METHKDPEAGSVTVAAVTEAVDWMDSTTFFCLDGWLVESLIAVLEFDTNSCKVWLRAILFSPIRL